MKDSLNHLIQKIKSFWATYREEIFITLIIILVGTASYGAGVLSAKTGHAPIEIRQNGAGVNTEVSGVFSSQPKPLEASQSESVIQSIPQIGSIVASKNGVAYYLPGCSGSSRILDKNKIYFKNEDEAKVAGYHLAGNCKK